MESISLVLDSQHVTAELLREVYHEKVLRIKGKDYILDVHHQKEEDDDILSIFREIFTDEEEEYIENKLNVLVFDYLHYQKEKDRVEREDKDETIDDYVEVKLEIELEDLKRDLGQDKEIKTVEKAIRFLWD